MLASVLHTVIIYAVVIFAMRLMGKRQLGELRAIRAGNNVHDFQCCLHLH